MDRFPGVVELFFGGLFAYFTEFSIFFYSFTDNKIRSIIAINYLTGNVYHRDVWGCEQLDATNNANTIVKHQLSLRSYYLPLSKK